MQWWCAARDVAWDWVWQPYPGVWLFIAAVLAAYVTITRRVAAAGEVRVPQWRHRGALFAAGLLLLWAALDWPIGALGAGYLASVHMLQFLVIGLTVPPLLLLGIPPAAFAALARRPEARLIGRLTHPLLTLLVFNAIVIATHLPAVTDSLMPTQFGSFAVDSLWLGGGLLYWWPLISRVTERPAFTAPVRMGYLFANMVFMTAPGALITFSHLPIYGIYELAPPIPGVTPIDDQRVAGLMMKLGGGTISWIAISILFIRWNREENRLLARDMQRVASR